MTESEIDANSENVTFSEHCVQKPKFNANSTLLFQAISDLNLSQHFDHTKDTDTIRKGHNIYSSQTEENEEQNDDADPKIDDEEVRQNETSSATTEKTDLYSKIILSVVGCVTAIVIIGVVIFFFLKSTNKEDAFRAKQIAKVKQKCKEYTELACTLNPSGNKNLSHIIDGTEVPQGMLPHQVYLSFPSEPRLQMTCGGSLINEKFILTAAHCVKNALIDKGIVVLGTIDIRKAFSNESYLGKVSKVHLHPDYTGKKFENDLCLVELIEKVKFSSDLRPVCLNTKIEKYYDSMIMAGWGTTKTNSSSYLLQMVELRIDDKIIEICRERLEENNKIVDEMGICTAHLTQGPDSGDSGGPLVVKLKSNCTYTWEQIGIFIITGGHYTGSNHTMMIFTRVEHFITWIASVAWPD